MHGLNSSYALTPEQVATPSRSRAKPDPWPSAPCGFCGGTTHWRVEDVPACVPCMAELLDGWFHGRPPGRKAAQPGADTAHDGKQSDADQRRPPETVDEPAEHP